MEAWRAAFVLEPGRREYRVGLAVALSAVGRYREAVPHFRAVVRTSPDRAEAWVNLGLACRESGEIGEAVEAFDQAVRLEPGAPRIHIELGVALRGAGRLEAALHALDRALALHPGHVDALHQRGRVLLRAGQFEEAEANLRAALARAPDREDVRRSLDELLGSGAAPEEDTEAVPVDATRDLEARLEVFGVAELLEFLGHARRSGRLVVEDGALELEGGRLLCGWVEGQPSFADRLREASVDLGGLELPEPGAPVDSLVRAVLHGERASLEAVDAICFTSAVEALAVLIERAQGSARFTCRPAEPRPGSGMNLAVGADPQGVLLEVFRRQDEARALHR